MQTYQGWIQQANGELELSKRITIVMTDEVVKILRKRQADEIRRSEMSYSFSRVVDDTLKKALKI